MERYDGVGVSPGIAIGKIKVYQKKSFHYDAEGSETVNHNNDTADCEAEISRYENAAEQAKKRLLQLREKARKEVGAEQASVFEAYQLILEDQQFHDSVRSIIQEEHAEATYAVAKTRDQFAAMFAEMNDDYMKERAADIVDVVEQVLEVLAEIGMGEKCAIEAKGKEGGKYAVDMSMNGRKCAVEEKGEISEPYILFAKNLLPSELIQLDKSSLQALVMTGGSLASHVAILARTMGIPTVMNVDIPLERLICSRTENEEGDNEIGDDKAENAYSGMVIIDGTAGTVYLDPDEKTLTDMQRLAGDMRKQGEELSALKGKETSTADGKRILLYANISGEEEAALALENDAEGIGLFRSEFLYFKQNDWPNEEEQFAIYKRIVQAMEGKRTIIRTMDIGADKSCGYFGLKPEENPALGCRGIRVSLARPEIFKTQLRAIFRAAAFGQVAVMYPMITSVEEIHKIQKIVRQAETELKETGTDYRIPEQGVMIETPAAAIISEALAQEVDFFSIGTNDLTQYTLAADRQNADLAELYDTHHPAVLKLIAMTAENAHKAGIRVGICGELAADVSLIGEFLKMGIDELSVSPNAVLAVRRAVRKMG